MKKYTAKITVRGNKETKGLKLQVYADNDSDANSKVWQRISVMIEPDDDGDVDFLKNTFGFFD